jgi:putative spermidine/putrescine transport system permease protein
VAVTNRAEVDGGALAAGEARRGLKPETRILLGHLALLAPAVLLLLIFFIIPIVRLLLSSFFDDGFTLEHYERLWNVPVYLRVLRITFTIATLVTIVCLLLAYPVAYFLASVSARTSRLLIIFVLIPFWTSILVRTYAWMVLLQRNGVINRWLTDLGLIDQPLQLMYNRVGVMVGMVHVLLPFMILPLFAVMRGIDVSYIRAAQGLGANPLQTFIRVFFPLSLPGVAAGCLLVFILSLGFFITPALMGGRRDMMIAQLIELTIRQDLNFEFAAALSLVLLVISIAIMLVYNKLLGLDRIFGGDIR